MELQILDADTIEYNEDFNCRGHIVAASCRELANSIKEEGLNQPITVAPKPDGSYKLITGHRRFIAVTKILRRKSIKAIIDPTLSDPTKAKIVNLTENIQRDNLTLLHEIKSIQCMLSLGLTEEDIANRCGKTKGWVKQRLKVKDLPAVLQQELNQGLLKMSQVNTLHDYTCLNDKNKIFEIAKGMKKANMNRRNFDDKKYLTKKNQKIARSKKELMAMRDHYLDFFEAGMVSHMLNWACGELCDNDLYTFIEEHARENDFELILGIDKYIRPF